MSELHVSKWHLYHGNGIKDSSKINALPAPPPWRRFSPQALPGEQASTNPDSEHKVEKHFFQVDQEEIELVNAALYLRRPLLVTGPPGTGKSTLAHAVAYELDLGEVLVWPITSRATLHEALYRYDAIGRLQEANLDQGNSKKTPPIGKFIHLGPLGTALADSQDKPRVLLIDEIDKSDIDLPNDLLNIFEEGRFEIPELARFAEPVVSVLTHTNRKQLNIIQGQVLCKNFPLVIMTSNGERELPAPFLRRCLHLELKPPDAVKLTRIVNAHFHDLDVKTQGQVQEFIQNIITRRQEKDEYVATDQLLNAIYLTSQRDLKIELKTSLGDSAGKTLQDVILRTIAEIEGS